MNVQSLREEMVRLSRDLYLRGWALATSGNFSARVSSEQILITASGKDKGTLRESDLILINLEGHLLEATNETPSAESELHCSLYKRDQKIGSILHTHSICASVLSSATHLKAPLTISNYEMLKALSGVQTHHHTEVLPVFPNHQNMSALAENTLKFLEINPHIHGFLIAGHGLYSWGVDLAEAKRHVEALEFLLECEYRRHTWK